MDKGKIFLVHALTMVLVDHIAKIEFIVVFPFGTKDYLPDFEFGQDLLQARQIHRLKTQEKSFRLVRNLVAPAHVTFKRDHRPAFYMRHNVHVSKKVSSLQISARQKPRGRNGSRKPKNWNK